MDLSLRIPLLRFKEEFTVRVSQLSTTELMSSEIEKLSEFGVVPQALSQMNLKEIFLTNQDYTFSQMCNLRIKVYLVL